MFLLLFRNNLCPQQMFPSLRSPRNIMSNNVSQTICPRLPVPLGTRVPRHVFQARAPGQNSTKYRAEDLCVNLVCEYFCWMLGDHNCFFFSADDFLFLILFIVLKTKQKICNWEVLIMSHVLFKHGRTGVCDLEVAFFKATYSTWFNDM